MRKGILGAMGWLLVALLLLPVGAMAQGAKEKVRITAEVFDSYDNTFVRDEKGEPQNRRTHEKGGELWVKVKGSETFIPAASFNQEVEVGTELIFKVKLAKEEQGDWGKMSNFGDPSDWWKVLEWRVNGKVQSGQTDNEFSYTVPKVKSVHVGVRFQRKQFQVKVVYYRLRGAGIDYSANGGSWAVLSNESPKDLNRNGSLKFKAKAFDVADFSLNGVTYGRFLALSDMGSYAMSQGDLWIEVSFSDAATSRRYIQTLCQGDGEKERFQINTLPLVGTSTNPSHYPIAGVATGKEAKVRPFGIQPSDICQAPDRFVILAKPKRGSRLAYITIDNAVVHDAIFTVQDNEPRTVVGYFVKEGKQILMLSEVGKGAHIEVVRGTTELRAGDEVLPGDRLKVNVGDPSTVKSLRINGRRFAPGDEWLVQGSGDVLVELITTTKNKFNGDLAGAPLLQCEVIGGGSVKATAQMKNGTWGKFTSGQLLYADSTWGGTPLYCDTITLAPISQNDYRCVKFEVNGKVIDDLSKEYKHGVDNKDVYVRAVFVKKTEKPALVVNTKGAIGYVDVIDAATGQRLEEGTILKEGQRLRIQAKGSASEGAKVTEISVNDSTYTANGAVSWAKEVTVSAGDAKKDAFQVGATFEKATILPPTPGKPVLHIVKGKGLENVDFIVDQCGEWGALGEIYPILNGRTKNNNEENYYIAVATSKVPNPTSTKASDYAWVKNSTTYKITVVSYAANGKLVQVPCMGNSGASGLIRNFYWGDRKGVKVNWSKDVYVYIRKAEEDSVSATMEQYLDGKTGLANGRGLLVKYDQVREVSWEEDGDLWKGFVPKSGTLTFEAKGGWRTDCSLVSVTINDSLVVGEAGKVVPREVKLGEWEVPADAKDGDVRIVTVWRKDDERVLTYAKIGKGAIDSVMGSGVEIKNGAVLKTETSLKVCTTPDAGYRLAGIRVNGRFEPLAKVGAKKQTVRIPASGDVFVEAVFVKDNTYTLRISVLGQPKPMGDVEVIRGAERLATGAEVKGEDVLAITARPAVGKRLALLRVNGELFPNGNCYIVPSDRDVSVEATFVQEDGYALFVEQEGEGEVVVERKSAAQGVWSEIYSGDAINSTDEIRVKATKGTDYELQALFINQRKQHGAESGKYTEGIAVGQGNIYVRAIFKKKDDTERRVYIVTTPGGYVKVATPDGKELRDGDTIDASVKDLTVSSYAFPGNRAVLLQVNWENHKSGESYSVPQKGNVFVEVRFVPTHRTVLAIEVQNSALGGDVVVTDVETGARLYDGTQLQEGQTIRVEVTGIGQAAELPEPEVSGPAHRQSSGANTWVVEGSDGVVYVRVAFAKEYYTVVFNGGQIADASVEGTMDAQRVPVGIKTKLHLNQFTAKGYRFDGWKANDTIYPDGETVLNLAGKDGTAELTAQWRKVCEVTFKLNEGEMYLPENPMVVDAGTSLNLNDDYVPHRSGYTFGGWYQEKNFLKRVGSPFVVKENDVTLYARWEATGSNAVNVTFDLDGGQYLGSTENVVIRVASNEPVKRLEPDPTKEGYTFKWWQLGKNEYKFKGNVGANSITLKAVWEKVPQVNEYTVTFDANGGRPSVESQRVKKDGFASVPVVTREGWELQGWYDGVDRYKFTEKVTRDLALKAEWSPTVIFSEGVKVTDENARELSSGDAVRCGSSIDVRVHAPQGKRIKSVTIGGKLNSVNAKSFSDNWIVSRPTTIYVEWEEWKEFTVTFDSKGGTAVESQLVEEGKKAVKPADPSKADSTFVEWQLNNTKYEFDAPVTGDITLVAKWEKKQGANEHTVTFDADGGTLSNGQSILEVKVDHDMRAPKPADPKKANYDFVEWQLNGTKYEFNTPVTENITLVAKWEPKLECMVTFDANGGTLDNGESTKTEKVTKGKTVTKPNDPEKAGYDFIDWFHGTKKYEFTEKVNEDITLVASWTPNSSASTFTVTFDADGGKFSDGEPKRAVPVAKDGKVTKPADPERPGFDFVEWQLNDTQYDFNAPVTEKITLKAKWEEKQGVLQYTVTFDANGGTLSSGGASQQVSIAKNEKVEKPTDPKKQGFEFKGWFYNGQPYNFALPITEDITLVAQWAVKSGQVEFTVTFDAKGGKFSDGATTREVPVAKDGKVTKPADPEMDGHEFVGWYDGTDPYNFNDQVTKNITLVAQWKESNAKTEYTVTFDSDGGTPVIPQVVKKGEKVHEPADPTKANYDFVGWNLGKAPYDFKATVEADITLVAQWKEKKSGKQQFTVTFDFDNGTPVATQFVEDGGKVTKPDDPTKAGYKFVEWQLRGKKYEFSEKVTENITLVAKWEKKTSGKQEFTVTFDAAGGTFTNGSGQRKVEVEKGQKIQKPVEEPTRAGYTFNGWLLGGADYQIDTEEVNEDITLVAKWKEKVGAPEYIVTFDSKGGTAVQSETVEEGKSATKPAEPTKDGYKFVEWQLRGVRYEFTETVTSNITLVAVWKSAVWVDITVVDGNKKGVGGATVTIEDENGDQQGSSATTDPDGVAKVKDVPAPTKGTVTVKAKIDGKDVVVTEPVTVDEDGKAKPDTINLGDGNIKAVELTVVDAVTKKGIDDATVKVGAQTATTKDGGKVTLYLLGGKGIKYQMVAKKDGYADGKVKVSVNDKGIADPSTIELMHKKDVKITVKNGTDLVKDATVTIEDENGDSQGLPATTEPNGVATVKDVPAPTDGTVTVKAKIDGKDTVVTVPVTVDKDGNAKPNEIDFKDAKAVEVTVADARTKRGIEGATVKVGAQTAETKDKGEATLNLVAGKSGYPVLAKAAGYADGKVEISVDGDGKATPDTIRLKALKDVTIKVKNGDDPVKGADVTIVDENGDRYTATTDDQGNAVKPQVPKVPVPTKGTVTVKAQIDGKDTVVTVPVEVDQNGDATPNEIDFKDGRFKGVTLTVADGRTKKGIKDATVKVGTQTATAAKTDGKVTLNLMEGKKGYPVLAKAEGYADGEVVVSVNDEGIADPDTIWLTVVKDVKITVTDNGAGVPDATVTIVDGNGDPHEANTDAEGNTTVPKVPVPTDGTVTVKAKIGTDDKIVTVPVTVDENGKAEPSEIDLGDGNIKEVVLTVVDAVTKKGIEGATVIVGAQEPKTDSDGKVTLSLLGGTATAPTQYRMVAKKDGYADGKVKVSVNDKGIADPDTIKLTPVKDVTIKVTNGGSPVDGATVTIVDGNGDRHKAKTDDNGNAIVPKVPVPIKENGTVTVEKDGKKVTVPVTVDETGKATPSEIDLGDKNIKEVKLTVVDATTKQGINEAMVTVGVQEGRTDGDGEVWLNLMAGKEGYPVLAKADGYADGKADVSVDGEGVAKPSTIELTPLAAPYLNVFVVDQDLKPIDSVAVTILSGVKPVKQDTTKSEGWVKMQLTAGSYRISIKKDGYNETKPVEVTLEARGLDFTFVLQKKVQDNGTPNPVESELLAGVEMYPNPASVATVLHGVESAKRIAVYTLTGVQVMRQAVHGEEELRLQVESLAEGVYVVVVESANGERKALKLVVRR